MRYYILKWEVGQEFWECEYGVNMRCKLATKPVIDNGQLTFTAHTVEGGAEIQYLMTKGFEHYGPKLCSEPAYIQA